jgi:dipeptidyl aminopeptidase/acylaminoacyl peptidase
MMCMFLRKMKRACLLVVLTTFVTASLSTIATAQPTKRPFTVADEIGLTYFGGSEGMASDELQAQGAVRFSPDGNWFAVHTERGRLDLNSVEDSLRFYRRDDVETFMKRSVTSRQQPAAWAVTFRDKTGAIISDWRWLSNSSGVVFLKRTAGRNQQLVIANVYKQTIESLTSARETVGIYDVRDRQHFVYTASVPTAELERIKADRQGPMTAGSGHSLFELLFPNDPPESSRNYLWAVVRGRRFELKHDGAPIVPEEKLGALYLALSPDGHSLVTTLPIPRAPASWAILYPPPYTLYPYRIRAGEPASQYVRIDLQNGHVQALTDAPTSNDGGWWWAVASPNWSSDGQEVLLPGTFIRSQDSVPSHPCIAVLDLASNTLTCVETLKTPTETGVEGYHSIRSARFVDGNKRRIIVTFQNSGSSSYGTTEYGRSVEGEWKVARQFEKPPAARRGDLEVSVQQGLNDPPRLVATYNQKSRVMWDPNPQLQNIELGEARVYTWKDLRGQDWKGGLYLPTDFKQGQSYPLVIQTHGFPESEFQPSGLYPTAQAARALAGVGIAVLQVRERCPALTPDEAPCAVAGYEGAVKKLISEGIADKDKIGIIGFSRSCYYVMEMLTTSSLNIKAASITDGQMITYLQYMNTQGLDGDSIGYQFDSVVGAPPFGVGLQEWLKRSPGFRLDSIRAPLLVVAAGSESLLYMMWEPYAGLRYLHKPVDLVLLNTDEHVLTNPAVRMASQGGSVDWFRFWLQDYEDPNPIKADEYTRWRELRGLRAEKEKAVASQGAPH